MPSPEALLDEGDEMTHSVFYNCSIFTFLDPLNAIENLIAWSAKGFEADWRPDMQDDRQLAYVVYVAYPEDVKKCRGRSWL